MKTLLLTVILLAVTASSIYSDDLNWLNVERNIDIEIFPLSHQIEGCVSEKFVNQLSVDSLILDLISLNVDSVIFAGSQQIFYRIGDTLLIIEFSTVYNPGDTVLLDIYYYGSPQIVSTPFAGGGLFIYSDIVYSTHAPFGLKAWVPCLDDHRHKAYVKQYITIPDNFYVISNGELDSVVSLSGGRLKYYWTEIAKLSPYLQGFAAYDYSLNQFFIDTIPVTIATYPEDSVKAAYDLRRIDSMLYMFSSFYGDYPFCKIAYAEVELPGAMENQNCILTGSILFTGTGTYEITHGHELSHQWWGDYVTPLDYGEVWLAEGWATFSEGLIVELFTGVDAMHTYMHDVRQQYISWEASYGYHTTHNPPFQYYYSKLTYERPGAVLYALRFALGDSLFFSSAREVINQFGDSTATWENVSSVFSNVAGRDLTWYFDQWLNGIGTPSLYYEKFSKISNSDSALVISWTTSNTSDEYVIESPVIFYLNNTSTWHLASADNDTDYNYYNIEYDSFAFDPYRTQFVIELVRKGIDISSVIPLDQAVILSWTSSSFSNISGYNVYKAQYPFEVYDKVNTDLILDTTYLVDSLTNNLEYSLYVTYILNDWESRPSDTVMAKPINFPFDREILLVDETEGGSGGMTIMPTDYQVDSAYNEIFYSIPHDIYHCDTSLPDITTLGHYKTVFWHSDEYTSTCQLLDNYQLMQSYLSAGGKLILSGWRVYEGAELDILCFLKLDSAILVTTKDFQSAQGQIYFPDVHIDSSLMLPAWVGKMDRGMYLVSDDCDTLEVWGPNSAYYEKIVTLGNRGNLNFILNTFPLYFIENSEARNFVQACFQYLGQTGVDEEENNDESKQTFSINYLPSGNVVFKLPSIIGSRGVQIKLYDITGRQLWSGSLEEGSKTFNLQWEDSSGDILPAGSYLIFFESENFQYRRKLFKIF